MSQVASRLAVLLAVFTVPRLSTAAGEHRRYALIVATNRSLDADAEPLRFADDDGARYHELFAVAAREAHLLAEMDAETRALHPGAVTSAPTRANLLQELAAMNASMAADRRAGIETDFYFIYTGHGAAEYGEGYVNLADGRLGRSDLFDLVIRPSQATYNHIIIDACQSYYMVYSRGEGEWQPDRVAEDYSGAISSYQRDFQLDRYPNTGVILSTSSDRESHEWSAYAAGIFSHQLRSALVGTADLNIDGSVDYLEVEGYLAAANAAVIDPKARVAVYAKPPRADPGRPLLARGHATSMRTLVLAAPLSGRMYLEDERGVRYSDFHKSSDGPLEIGLLPNRRYVLISPAGQVALPDLATVRLADVAWQAVALAGRSDLSEAFRKQLYQVPFSRQFFDGYRLHAGRTAQRTQ